MWVDQRLEMDHDRCGRIPIVDRKDFVTRMEELLEQPAGSMTGEEKLEDMDGWDSLTLIRFMAMADEHCGRKPTPPEVGRCETVNDLYRLVNV
jgi:acyl carrier protein